MLERHELFLGEVGERLEPAGEGDDHPGAALDEPDGLLHRSVPLAHHEHVLVHRVEGGGGAVDPVGRRRRHGEGGVGAGGALDDDGGRGQEAVRV